MSEVKPRRRDNLRMLVVDSDTGRGSAIAMPRFKALVLASNFAACGIADAVVPLGISKLTTTDVTLAVVSICE